MKQTTKYILSIILLTILLAVAYFGALGLSETIPALASTSNDTYMPLVTMADKSSRIEIIPGSFSGLVEIVPLENDLLLVITSADSFFNADIYDAWGAMTPLEGWEFGSGPAKIKIAGCVWVAVELLDYGIVQVHKINLPAGMACQNP